MKDDRIERLISLFNENVTKIVLEHEDYIDTAQALRQLKQLQEAEPLRTEIIEKYNDGYENGLRRAAEIIQNNLDGSMGVDDMLAAILNEANNRKIAEVMEKRDDWWVEFESYYNEEWHRASVGDNLLEDIIQGTPVRHRTPKVTLSGEVEPEVIESAKLVTRMWEPGSNPYDSAKALLSCVEDDQ